MKRPQPRELVGILAGFVVGTLVGAGVFSSLYVALLLVLVGGVGFLAGLVLGLWQAAEVGPPPPPKPPDFFGKRDY